MSGKRSKRVLISVTIVALMVLYVLSSGPTRSLAFRRYTTYATSTVSASGAMGIDFDFGVEDEGVWWPKVYAPLTWIAEIGPWDEAMYAYWDLFPIKEVTPPIP